MRCVITLNVCNKLLRRDEVGRKHIIEGPKANKLRHHRLNGEVSTRQGQEGEE